MYQKMLYEQLHAFALKIVFRYIYNYEEALEVTNDGFVKIFLNIKNFDLERAENIEPLFKGWMKKIMVNTSIDLLRKKMFLPEIGGIPEYVWDIKDTSDNAEQQMIFKELITLIKKLPPVYRIAFNMQVIDGYSHTEIAETLGIAVGTSKSHVFRAKALLQEYLKNAEEQVECSI